MSIQANNFRPHCQDIDPWFGKANDSKSLVHVLGNAHMPEICDGASWFCTLMGLVSTLSETFFELFCKQIQDHCRHAAPLLLGDGLGKHRDLQTSKDFFELLLNHGCKGSLLEDLEVILCRILFLKIRNYCSTMSTIRFQGSLGS